MIRVSRLILIMLLTLVIVTQNAQPISAASVTGTLVFTPDCTFLGVSGGGAVNWDRDTTGEGKETIVLLVTDGLGTILFQASDTRAPGISTTFFDTYTYVAAPVLNPITAVLYSPAGEDLPAQTLVTGTGICDTLPTPTPLPSAVPLPTATTEIPLPTATVEAPVPAPTSPSGYGGPAIPGQFVLRTIICDTPVYDGPAGLTVGTNVITTGQTWYVNTSPVLGADGQLWTEIFVAGLHNGYIPSRCVEFQVFGAN